MGARWFDPALGRWLSADTLVPDAANPQSFNRYSWVLGNPLKYVDPTGHLFESDGGGTEPEEPSPPPVLPDWLLRQLSDPRLEALLIGEGYDPKQSMSQAWMIVWNWFWEHGDPVLYFGPNSSLTQDVIFDRGMTEFRQAWAANGYMTPYTYRDTADERHEGSPVSRVLKGIGVYAREHLFVLPLSTVGWGSTTAKGAIDPVGGTLGSLDRITVRDAGKDMVQIEVFNRMNRASALRIPGMEGVIPEIPRGSLGIGGTLDMFFIWQEPQP